MQMGGRGGQELGGVEGAETVIRIFSIKGENFKKSPRLSNNNPSTRHEKSLFQLLVRSPRDSSKQYRLLLWPLVASLKLKVSLYCEGTTYFGHCTQGI